MFVWKRIGTSRGFCACVSSSTTFFIWETTYTSYRRLSAKNVKLIRPTLFNYIATREELQAAANELWKFIEKDGLNVKIHDVYPLSEIVRATKDIEGRKTTGKLVLTP